MRSAVLAVALLVGVAFAVPSSQPRIYQAPEARSLALGAQIPVVLDASDVRFSVPRVNVRLEAAQKLSDWEFQRSRHNPLPAPKKPEIAPLEAISVVSSQPAAPRIQQPVSSGVEQWRDLVAFYWPAEHVDRMLRIMDCESHGNPNAVNPRSGAAGLFQIMPGWQRSWPGDYFDPWTNASVAYSIWLVQGYGAWVCKG